LEVQGSWKLREETREGSSQKRAHDPRQTFLKNGDNTTRKKAEWGEINCGGGGGVIKETETG